MDGMDGGKHNSDETETNFSPKKKRKIRKIKPYTLKWEKMANELARSWCPTVYPCKECGHPVVNGYCCGYCGSTDPT